MHSPGTVVADRVEREHDRVLVTRNGRPSFVLVSPDDLAALEETVDILQDDEPMESLRTSRRGDDRVIHEIDDDRKVVVHRVQHRRVVSRPR